MNNTDSQITNQLEQFNHSTGYGTSARYVALNTKLLVAEFERNGYHVDKIYGARVRSEGKLGFQKHMLRIRHSELSFTGAAQARGIVPEILMLNSFDGSAAYRLKGCIYRAVCANGLIAGKAFQFARVVHTGTALEQVLTAMEQVVTEFPKLVDTVNRWSNVQLSNAQLASFAHQAVGLVLPATAISSTWQSLLNIRRNEDRFQDLWTAFNVVQENLTRYGVSYTRVNAKGQLANSTTRAIKSIDRSVGVNTQLWDLAETFAITKVG